MVFVLWVFAKNGVYYVGFQKMGRKIRFRASKSSNGQNWKVQQMGLLLITLFQSMEKKLQMWFTKACLKMEAILLLSVLIDLLGLILVSSWLVYVLIILVLPFSCSFFKHLIRFIVAFVKKKKIKCFGALCVYLVCVF